MFRTAGLFLTIGITFLSPNIYLYLLEKVLGKKYAIPGGLSIISIIMILTGFSILIYLYIKFLKLSFLKFELNEKQFNDLF
ncbi:hypothetical protein GCM10007103_30700 [Salinimicrobium marinum]|uniref:Uncharacterized protein n=1 Tax=Salinimicrobium marinum TaxID=680283 RepID=A0A918VZR5_9FLAO|nr:hypothetical protein GCM10007103_30700 [Salinimicrobium marinum]